MHAVSASYAARWRRSICRSQLVTRFQLPLFWPRRRPRSGEGGLLTSSTNLRADRLFRCGTVSRVAGTAYRKGQSSSSRAMTEKHGVVSPLRRGVPWPPRNASSTSSRAGTIFHTSTSVSPEPLYDRLSDHNAGHCPHTARYRPWSVHVGSCSPRLPAVVVANGSYD